MDRLEWVIARLVSISNQMHEVEEETINKGSAIDIAFFAARIDRVIVRLNDIDQQNEAGTTSQQ